MSHLRFVSILFVLGFVLSVFVGAGSTALAAPEGTVYTVTNANDSGAGSLRQAILDANANPGGDTIAFNFPGTGVQYIQPLTDLPIISDTVNMNGYTQPGSSANTLNVGSNAVVLISVDGSKTACKCALQVHAIRTTISGLALNAPERAVDTEASSTNLMGNIIGLDVTGVVPQTTKIGVWVGADNAVIGGTTPATRNLISGNRTAGIHIHNDVQFTNVRGNLIGTLKDGKQVPSSGFGYGNNHGIDIAPNARNNTIGGSDATMRNILSGNIVGVSVDFAGSNTIQNNYFNVSADGTSFVSIVFHKSTGVLLDDASNTQILDNVMAGTNAGVYIKTGCNCGWNPHDNHVRDNLIGTDATGKVALHRGRGVVIAAGYLNYIETNLISGNKEQGILISGKNADQNFVHGNDIGLDIGGNALGNGGSGIFLRSGTSLNEIGGTAFGDDNRIAYNGGNGITVLHHSGDETWHNSFLVNSIHDNVKLGIDLGNGGVTPNDKKDPDLGPNETQNYPVLTKADFVNKQVTGSLNSTPNRTFRIEFYITPACDASGHGEGEVFAGFKEVTTNAQGKASFVADVNNMFVINYVVSATATDLPHSNTSEFSNCVSVQP